MRRDLRLSQLRGAPRTVRGGKRGAQVAAHTLPGDSRESKTPAQAGQGDQCCDQTTRDGRDLNSKAPCSNTPSVRGSTQRLQKDKHPNRLRRSPALSVTHELQHLHNQMLPASFCGHVCRQNAVPTFRNNSTASRDGFSSQDRQVSQDKIQVTGSRRLLQPGATSLPV